MMMNLKRHRHYIADLAPLRETLVDNGYAGSEEAFNVFNDAFKRQVLEIEADEGRSENVYGSNEIKIYGRIVNGETAAFYQYYGLPAISSDIFMHFLEGAKGKEVTLRVNSPGGVVTEAAAMRQMIAERQSAGTRFRSVIDGAAASAASVIALSADDVTMAKAGLIYIHRPVQFLEGAYYADELGEMSDELERYAPQLARMYDERGINYNALGYSDAAALLHGKTGNGTMVFADEALASNMIDRIEADPPKEAASPSASVNAKRSAPANLRFKLELHDWMVANGYQDEEESL